MNFSTHSRSRSRSSNAAVLLQPVLHNFCALAPVNHLHRITYRRNCQKSPKSNAALLLPLFVPVSPLLRYSYKKMGGYPPPRFHASLAPCFSASRSAKSFRFSTCRLRARNSFRISTYEKRAGGGGNTGFSLCPIPMKSALSTFNHQLSAVPKLFCAEAGVC
jgi:hypothetical protein